MLKFFKSSESRVDIIWKGKFAISRTSILAICKDLETFCNRLKFYDYQEKDLTAKKKASFPPFSYLTLDFKV